MRPWLSLAFTSSAFADVMVILSASMATSKPVLCKRCMCILVVLSHRVSVGCERSSQSLSVREHKLCQAATFPYGIFVSMAYNEDGGGRGALSPGNAA